MLNLTNMVRAPMRNFEVTMHRRTCLNAVQNARKCIAYVRAINADEAKKAANRLPGKQSHISFSISSRGRSSLD